MSTERPPLYRARGADGAAAGGVGRGLRPARRRRGLRRVSLRLDAADLAAHRSRRSSPAPAISSPPRSTLSPTSRSGASFRSRGCSSIRSCSPAAPRPLSVFFDSLAAYALSRLDFPGKTLAFYVVLATLMMPFQITLIPLFQTVFDFGWLNTYQGLIVPQGDERVRHFPAPAVLRHGAARTRRGGAHGRRQRVSHLLVDHAAAGQARAGDARRLPVHEQLERFSLAAGHHQLDRHAHVARGPDAVLRASSSSSTRC